MRHGGLGLLDPYVLLEQAGALPGFVVADLGCGALGHFVFPAAEMVGSSGRVYAVDVQRSALQLIEREVREHQAWHVEPVWADVERSTHPHVPHQSVDLTLIVNALYLAGALDRWIAEAWRMTKPGGGLLIVDWQPVPTLLGPPADVRLSPQDVVHEFSQRGWSHEAAMEASDHHYALFFRRPLASAESRIEFISHSLSS